MLELSTWTWVIVLAIAALLIILSAIALWDAFHEAGVALSRGLVPMSHLREKGLKSPVVKRSIVIAGHKTAVSVEDEFWNSLKKIAGERGMTVAALVAAIDANRNHANLSSAIRLFVLGFYRDQRR
jgi:predicted DNA-binding ribbon-helix-helix protein